MTGQYLNLKLTSKSPITHKPKIGFLTLSTYAKAPNAMTSSWKCCKCRHENYYDKWVCGDCKHERCKNCKDLLG